MSNLAGLEELLHSYFHQGWVDDYPNPWDAVDEFIADRPQLAAGLPEEISRALQERRSEAQLKQLFRDLRCGYHIQADDWTHRGWLTAVADWVKRATAA